MWWDSDADRLPGSLLETLRDPASQLLLSVVNVWEMQIKTALGKLELRTPLAKLVLEQQERNDIAILPVDLQHVLTLDGLGDLHRDPFERLLIAQAQTEGLTLVSKDGVFKNYGVSVLWD